MTVMQINDIQITFASNINIICLLIMIQSLRKFTMPMYQAPHSYKQMAATSEVNVMCRSGNFLMGGDKLQTRAGPKNFTIAKANILENRGGTGPLPLIHTPLEPPMYVTIILFSI